MRVLLVLGLISLIACKVEKPRVALSNPWFSTESNLKIKAEKHETYTLSMLDKQGLYLYRGYSPWGDQGDELQNYLDSHHIADAPAWHGQLMAALALRWANTGKSQDINLGRMADALLLYYQLTGVEGLFGRAHLADYHGKRLSWMLDQTQDPKKYWKQSSNGSWWRTGLAKNHFNLALFGAAVPLTLHRRGHLQLSLATEQKLIRLLVPAARHLLAGGYRIRDWDGSFTEFGDLRPDVTFGPSWPALKGIPNGFNQILVLHILKSASAYDELIRFEYEKVAEKWARGIGQSMELVGEVIARAGHAKIEKPSFSDMSAFGLAAFSLYLQETRRKILKGVNKGMTGLWEFMKFERNPTFSFPYFMIRPQEARIWDCEEDLRLFPMPEHKRAFIHQHKDTEVVQPLGNRPSNTNYWKSNPFRLQTAFSGPLLHPTTQSPLLYGAHDYLLAYEMGRFLGLIPEE